MKPSRKKKKPRPLKGEVIPTSTVAMAGMIAVMTILGVTAVALIAGWFAGWSVWALVGGLVVLPISLAGIAMGVYQLSARERLFIGTDRFQVVHRVKGEDEVVTQVRFANIALITLEEGDQKNYIGIDLDDLDDPDAYQADDNFQTTRSINGYHVMIWGGYTETLATIYALLRAKVEEES